MIANARAIGIPDKKYFCLYKRYIPTKRKGNMKKSDLPSSVYPRIAGLKARSIIKICLFSISFTSFAARNNANINRKSNGILASKYPIV